MRKRRALRQHDRTSARGTPTKQAARLMTGWYESAFGAWRSVLEQRWHRPVHFRWLAENAAATQLRVRLTIFTGSTPRMDAHWMLRVAPLGRRPTPEELEQVLGDDEPVRALDASARKLTQLPLALAPKGRTLRLFAQVIALTEDDTTAEVSVHPADPFPPEVLMRRGTLDAALLRGLAAIRHQRVPVVSDVRIGRDTRFVQELPHGSRTLSAAAGRRALRGGPPILITWPNRPGQTKIRQLLRLTALEIRIPTSAR